jgi:hypothetical protein
MNYQRDKYTDWAMVLIVVFVTLMLAIFLT